jgi:hypothetical protein
MHLLHFILFPFTFDIHYDTLKIFTSLKPSCNPFCCHFAIHKANSEEYSTNKGLLQYKMDLYQKD